MECSLGRMLGARLGSMPIRSITVVLCALLAGLPAQALVNAKPVSESRFKAEYPWMVAVVHNDLKGVCGGVLIAPDWVLTAAHCTALKKHVLVGHPQRQKARRIEILNAYRHSDFDSATMQNDIGVIQLAESVDLPLAPIPTVRQARAVIAPGREGILLGYGRIEGSRALVPQLMEGRVKLNELRFAGSQIAYNYKGGGPCARDSGGPMVLNTLDSQPFVATVATATDGELCNKNGGLAVYTNIAAVRTFIERFVEL